MPLARAVHVVIVAFALVGEVVLGPNYTRGPVAVMNLNHIVNALPIRKPDVRLSKRHLAKGTFMSYLSFPNIIELRSASYRSIRKLMLTRFIKWLEIFGIDCVKLCIFSTSLTDLVVNY